MYSKIKLNQNIIGYHHADCMTVIPQNELVCLCMKCYPCGCICCDSGSACIDPSCTTSGDSSMAAVLLLIFMAMLMVIGCFDNFLGRFLIGTGGCRVLSGHGYVVLLVIDGMTLPTDSNVHFVVDHAAVDCAFVGGPDSFWTFSYQWNRQWWDVHSCIDDVYSCMCCNRHLYMVHLWTIVYSAHIDYINFGTTYSNNKYFDNLYFNKIHKSLNNNFYKKIDNICDKITYKNFIKISIKNFYSNLICTSIYSYTYALIEKFKTFTIGDNYSSKIYHLKFSYLKKLSLSYLSKIYHLKFSYFKKLSFKVYPLESHFLKKIFFKVYLLTICPIMIHQILYNLAFCLIRKFQPCIIYLSSVPKHLSFSILLYSYIKLQSWVKQT